MKSTSDIWFSAYLKSKGYEITDFTLIAKGKARYSFNIDEERWKKEKFEFLKSDISKLKQTMVELKDLIH